ncbi:hypothetical protein BJ742DRAFT_808182 [Cladochytrium replicatum]|nr:hypothetical protein BJ742DRAFT_808182 [Cladochytrium replicatum]
MNPLKLPAPGDSVATPFSIDLHYVQRHARCTFSAVLDFVRLRGVCAGRDLMWKWVHAPRCSVLVRNYGFVRVPLSLTICISSDTKTHYCATRETCSTANGTAVCVQGCLVGSAQGSQECGTGCIQIGNVCCGSNSTKFWSCGQGGRCDTANSACFAFGTNAQEPGGEVNSKITTQAKPVESGQSPSQSSAGSGPSATSPVSGNPGGSGNPNSGEGLGTFGIILVRFQHFEKPKNPR